MSFPGCLTWRWASLLRVIISVYSHCPRHSNFLYFIQHSPNYRPNCDLNQPTNSLPCLLSDLWNCKPNSVISPSVLSPTVSLYPLFTKVQASQQHWGYPFCSDLSERSSHYSPHPLIASSFPSPALVLQSHVHFSKWYWSFLWSCAQAIFLADPCSTLPD